MEHSYLHTTVGSLYVEERLPNTKNSTSARWKCRCKCGKYKILRSSNLSKLHNTGCRCYGTRLNDHTGRRFGKLTVIERVSNTRNHHAKWLCKCDCGNEVSVYGTHLIRENSTSCGCLQKSKTGKKHHQWSGIGDISGDYWASYIKNRWKGSKGRNELEFTIDKEYAWQLFLDQDKKCSLTGLELKFPKHGKDKNWTASLDRIDSSKGYIEGNVQWVHKDINMMKRTYTQEHFIKMCKLVAENK